MKKFTTLLVAAVLAATLCFVGCGKNDDRVPAPETVTVTNSSFTLVRGENTLTAEVQPSNARQDVVWTVVGTLPAGVTLDGNKVTVSKNTANGVTLKIKAAALTDPTVSQTKTFTVDNAPDPAIEIRTEEELRAMGNDLTNNYKLMNDITLTSDWQSLGKADVANESDVVIEKGVGLAGTFDGNGHTIYDFNLHADHDPEKIGTDEPGWNNGWKNGWNIGFFYKLEDTGIVQNLGIVSKENGKEVGLYSVGWSGVIAGTSYGTVRNSYTNVNVFMENSPGGALLGTNNGVIEHCYAIGNVRVSRDLGEGNVNPNTSGFVNANTGMIYESYVLDTSVEAAIGYHAQTDEEITKSSAWMRTAQNYKDAGWDETIWYLADGFYPQLKHEGFVAPVPTLTVTNESAAINYKTQAETPYRVEYAVTGLLDESVTFALKEPVEGVSVSETGLITLGEQVTDGTEFTVVVTSKTNTEIKGEKEFTVLRKEATPIADATAFMNIFGKENATEVNFGKEYILTGDIEISLEQALGVTTEKTIGFAGILNGNGHTLKFDIEQPGTRDFALFKQISAGGVIENVTIEAVCYIGSNSAVVAYNNYGTIRNVFVKGTASCTGGYISGLVFNNYGAIENCIVTVKRTINDSATVATTSGLVCNNYEGGTIANCYVDASVTNVEHVLNEANETLDNACVKDTKYLQTKSHFTAENGWDETIWYLADGFYPQLKYEGFVAPVPTLTITNEASILDYNSDDEKTRQVQYAVTGLLDESATFALKETVEGVSVSETGLITLGEQVTDGTKFTVVVTSVANTAVKDEKEFTVLRKAAEEYQPISSFAQLLALTGEVTEDVMSTNYRLTQDIVITEGWINDTIGTSNNAFKGIFDGNGYSIIGFAGGNDQRDNGLFGVIDEKGIVKNLRVTTGSRTRTVGGNSAGIARTNYGTIENVVLEGEIDLTGGIYVAGIAFANYGTIRNCICSVNLFTNYAVNREDDRLKVGGIAWDNYSGAGAVIENCFVDSTVTQITQALGAANATLDANCMTTEALKQVDYAALGFDPDVWDIKKNTIPTLIKGCSVKENSAT